METTLADDILQIISCLNHSFRYAYILDMPKYFIGIRIFSCLFDPLKMLIAKGYFKFKVKFRSDLGAYIYSNISFPEQK